MLAHKNAMDALICTPADLLVASGVVRNRWYEISTRHTDGIHI
jgi:hypothetical protein